MGGQRIERESGFLRDGESEGLSLPKERRRMLENVANTAPGRSEIWEMVESAWGNQTTREREKRKRSSGV